MNESERHAGLDPTGKWTAGALGALPKPEKAGPPRQYPRYCRVIGVIIRWCYARVACGGFGSADGKLLDGALGHLEYCPASPPFFRNARRSSPSEWRARFTVLKSSIAIVIGPTPPGTGVIALATRNASEYEGGWG